MQYLPKARPCTILFNISDRKDKENFPGVKKKILPSQRTFAEGAQVPLRAAIFMKAMTVEGREGRPCEACSAEIKHKIREVKKGALPRKI
jgi:hypothetical protein